MTQSRVSCQRAATDLSLPPNIWLSAGLFGLVAGALVLLLNDSLSDPLVWLVENYRNLAPPLQEEEIQEIANGVRIWGWSGIVAGSVSLIFSWHTFRLKLGSMGSWLVLRVAHPLPLPADRFSCAFFLVVIGVFAFTALAHWSLTAYETVDWFEGEDGVSEWWSVATYLAAGALAKATAWKLRQSDQRNLAWFHFFLAGVFLLGALEEIS